MREARGVALRFNGGMSYLSYTSCPSCRSFKSIACGASLIALMLCVPACGSGSKEATASAAPAAAGKATSSKQPEGSAATATAATAPAAVATPVANTDRNPCDLLTKAEVEEALGTPVGEPRRNSNVCYFPPAEKKSLRSISYSVRWTGGREAMKTSKSVDTMIGALGDKDVRDAMKKAEAKTAAELEGLGDEASFKLVKLYVRKGDATLTIDTRLCSRSQAIAVARKAVARL